MKNKHQLAKTKKLFSGFVFGASVFFALNSVAIADATGSASTDSTVDFSLVSDQLFKFYDSTEALKDITPTHVAIASLVLILLLVILLLC